MIPWNVDDFTEKPLDLMLLNWLRDHPDQTAYHITVGMGMTKGNQWAVEQALKRLRMRHLAKFEEKKAAHRLGYLVRYWSAVGAS